MNCTDVAAILDDHAPGRLSAADRCALDEHVTSCEPCTFAWHAQSVLLALPVPAAPADLLDRVLRALSSRPAHAPRRARTRAVLVSALLAAGAALAAITAVKLYERANEQPASATSNSGGARESAQTSAASTQSSAPAAPTASRPDSAVAIDDVDTEYFMALRVPPDYPPDAIERKLEGDVTVEYTIDERGAVKNARAVRSTDPVFEASAIASVSQWKYLPRVRAGKRVAVDGVQTVMRFQLTMPPPPPVGAKRDDSVRQSEAESTAPSQDAKSAEDTSAAQRSAHPVDFATFERWMTNAWQRSAADDLRGAELVLDELRATYDLDDSQSNRVWTFYGYIYTRYADYGRAIDAYEKAVATKTAFWSEQWTSLASLYFARHQYDKALETLLTYKQRSSSGRISSEATAMIEKLRALGVTEDSVDGGPGPHVAESRER